MRWLPLALFSAMCWSQTIQSARTPEKCDAKLKTWQDEKNTLSYKSLSFEQLDDRSKELLFCELDYPEATEKMKWEKQRDDYSGVMFLRYQMFLERHKLWNMFLAEDEQGER